jgi:hypothetical protein
VLSRGEELEEGSLFIGMKISFLGTLVSDFIMDDDFSAGFGDHEATIETWLPKT